MNIISVNPAWCYTGDEFGYMYVPTCFCRQEFEKWQCINSSVLTDFPLFLNEHISLLHQNGSLMLQNLTRTKIIIIIKSFRKKEVEMYQQVKIMRRDGGRELQWADCTVGKTRVHLLSFIAFAAHVSCLRVRQQKGISVVNWI